MTLTPATLLRRLEALIWGKPTHERPSWQSGVLRWARTALVLGRDLAMGQLTLRAMSLVYTTLLSIVPLLALSFSVLKAFGVHNQIQPMLLRLLEPLGEQGVEVSLRIAEFIQNMNVGVLGAVGLALLLYTAISLVQKIEESLNYIWHIPQPRRLGERFSRYFSVLIIGPILVFSALGATATVMNIDTVRQLLAFDALSQVVELATRLVPYVLIIAAFTFVYLFIPNTRVRWGPALVGGMVGGVVWQNLGLAVCAVCGVFGAVRRHLLQLCHFGAVHDLAVCELVGAAVWRQRGVLHPAPRVPVFGQRRAALEQPGARTTRLVCHESGGQSLHHGPARHGAARIHPPTALAPARVEYRGERFARARAGATVGR